MININNLCFSYDKTTPPLLNNVNIHIPKGVYLSVVGENGSCKTTLIKLILNLLKPDRGEIIINTKNIGYVPQRVDGFNSDFPISVYEVVKVHGSTLNVEKSSINSLIDTVLNKVNMTDFKNSLIGSLSGGQQQRIFIARSLMGIPDLLILDEPSTGVDRKNQLEIYSLLHKINKDDGTTIISIEHNLEMALKYSSHILKVEDGNYTLEEISNSKEDN